MSYPPFLVQWFRRWKLQRDQRRGYFSYFGETIHFPPHSLAHRCAVADGLYEAENLKILQCAHRPGSTMLDIGANIGLMSAPILQQDSTAQIIAVEASPLVTPFLAKTVEQSPNQSRWKLIEAAVSAEPGTAQFYCSPQDGNVYDGLRDTQRAGDGTTQEVRVTTLDEIWEQCGRPDVSLIKIDVEGAESDVIKGGSSLLREAKPIILLEWNLQNLAAYGTDPADLYDLATELGYSLRTTPSLATVPNRDAVRFFAGLNESFLLLPD